MYARGRVDPESGSVQFQENQGLIDNTRASQWNFVKFTTIIFGSVGLFGVIAVALSSNISPAQTQTPALSTDEDSTGALDSLGRYRLKNYDISKTFSSFLPGVAGVYGTPMWAYYVNRGQAIATFGITNKDYALLEFEPANKAYQQTALTGFRTFLKGTRGGKTWEYQPFFPSHQSKAERDMLVGQNEVEIIDSSEELGLDTSVLYYTISHEDFPGLIRRTTFTNTGEEELSLDVIDGLAKLEPYGVDYKKMKDIGRTLEGWMKVYNLEESLTMPWYKLTSSTADSEVVTPIIEGNFAISFVESEEAEGATGNHELLPIIADPLVLFEQDSTLENAEGFLEADTIESLLSRKQAPLARTPCAFAATKITIQPGSSVTVVSVYGHAKSLDDLEETIAPKISEYGFVSKQLSEARDLADFLSKPVVTETADPVFDAYVSYNFMDNILRGGYPLLLGDPADPKVYPVFSRIHGDLERDYNWFLVDPAYFSHGPGNYRDVNQNRRSDVMFQPKVGDFNARTFFTYMQADGYNPLTVKNPTFALSPEAAQAVVSETIKDEDAGTAVPLLANLNPIEPGSVFGVLAKADVELKVSKEDFIKSLATNGDLNLQATFGEGFWADHWTYNLDLIDSYLTIYPDKLEELLWDSEPLPFFISPAYIAPRHEKYKLLNGEPRQVGATKTKDDYFGQAPNVPGWPWPCGTYQCMLDDSDKNNLKTEVMKVPMATKVAMLGLLKFATMDPWGMGVEYEGGKPGWLDALNGLPSLFGSGMPETFEALRILGFVRDSLSLGRDMIFPQEFDVLLQVLQSELATYSTTKDDFAYWNNIATAREEYRQAVRLHFTGNTVVWSADRLADLLASAISKMQAGVARAIETNNGVTPSYFIWEMTDYDKEMPQTEEAEDTTKKADKKDKVTDKSYLVAKGWKPTVLPLYLEGPVRRMKVLSDIHTKKALYTEVRNGPLYDSELSMYKISESLESQSPATGRVKSFSPGWLENESIWLHMSYKFYLELARAGLYEEFWTEAKTGLVPFMDPAVYGRSPLEASSFIASSAMPDESSHGQGFVSRLSGSTAEFLSMWNLLMAGARPFSPSWEGGVTLTLSPALPDWLFPEDSSDSKVSFTFLGSTIVTYHNAERKNTWDPTLTTEKIEVTMNDGSSVEIGGATIPSATAEKIRNLEAASIDVYLSS